MKIQKETNAYAVGFDFVTLNHRQNFEMRVTKKVNGEFVTYVNIISMESVINGNFDPEDYYIIKVNKYFENVESQTIKRKDGIYEDFSDPTDLGGKNV